MNALSCLLLKEENVNNLKGIRSAKNGQRIRHLMFADDSMFFFKATLDLCARMNVIPFDFFDKASCEINKDKSFIIFSSNNSPKFKRMTSKIFKIQSKDNLGKYLGVRIEPGRRRKEDFNDLIEKIERSLARWKGRLLSQARRLTLIKLVNQFIPIYLMSTFKLSKSIASKLDSININFFSSSTKDKRCIHMIHRDALHNPKVQGGLGTKRMNIFNRALLNNQFWRVLLGKNSLTNQWVNRKYGSIQ